MVKTIPSVRRIQLLLNTLAGERYIRRSLVGELIDELDLAREHPDAARAGRALLERLEAGIDDREYERRLSDIAEMTRPGSSHLPCADAAE